MPAQHIALALFLVLLAIGVIILISILVIVKRRIARRKSRIGRTTYNSCGHGLPKVWKSNIEKKINGTVKIRTEPQVFGLHYSENYDVYTSAEQAILSLDPTLEAPPLRDIRDFLLTARHNIMNPPPSRDYIEEYCQLYLWARHDLNPFGESEYRRFCELQTNLLEITGQPSGLNLKRLSHSTHRKKHELLVSPSEHETLTGNSLLIHSSHVFTNDIISEIDSNVDRIETKTGNCSHRRDSCQSDGSQTALIDLEPVIVVNQSKTSLQPSRQIKLNESYNIQPDTKNLTRFNKGMENEGVNC
ncbi:hypothetical protein Smp_158090 [Schistosoma mansoni]|uniref:hypothetical protein n=1 Tax=Schistosoma mansoni TaxID=6183 RepID=UPI0001A625DB|nr:hypothetical protein Smp_158090 [Schistosoma mansoni]|eukprot:XP_018645125.1 hypothetical protein Smp_158090 [Schistosoma mansoni]